MRIGKAGFTLIELMIVVAILGILASVAVAKIPELLLKTKIRKTQAELVNLRTAIQMLTLDTNLLPNHYPNNTCTENQEIYLDNCDAGLMCSDGGFPGWAGPYLQDQPLDPWGTMYYFDPDITCNGQTGCEGIPDGTVVMGIQSFGPDKTQEYGGDDIILVTCRS